MDRDARLTKARLIGRLVALSTAAALGACSQRTPPVDARPPSPSRPAAVETEADPVEPDPPVLQATSLLGMPLHSQSIRSDDPNLGKLLEAMQGMADAPDDPAAHVWYGRRLAYLWLMQEAVAAFSGGIDQFPDYAPLYRHRGHRYLSLRQFDNAIADLEKAAELIRGRPDEIEPDGMPNERNIPLTTTAFNVWYHVGLARYLKGDFEGALAAYRENMKHAQRYPDNLVAVSYWMFLTLRRLGRDDEARALLSPITPDLDVIEDRAYHRLLLMYKGLVPPEEAIPDGSSRQDLATLGYGIGCWRLVRGEPDKARECFEKVIETGNWPAFGYIAAEAELARMRRGR